MQWNFDEGAPRLQRVRTICDVLLFFGAVVLVVAVAVLPASHFTSGAVPGEHSFWNSLIFTGPLAFVAIAIYVRWRQRVRDTNFLLPRPEELTVTYRLLNGLIVLAIGGWALFSALNAWFDADKGQTYYTYVLEKEQDDDGRFEKYILSLANWYGVDAPPLDLMVDSVSYENVEIEGGCFRLVIKPGAFGQEWIAERDYYNRKAAGSVPGIDWQKECRAEWMARSAELNSEGRRFSNQ